MKKILVTTLVACALVSSALAQGLITFSATGTSTTDWVPGMIGYKAPGMATATLVPASVSGAAAQVGTYGNLNIALYGAPVGTALNIVNGVPDLTNWKIQTSAILQVLAAKGYMTGKSVTMDASLGAPAAPIELTVVAWTGTAANFTAAAAPGSTSLLAWTGDANSGGALHWTSGTGTPTAPYVITKGASAFNGLVLAPVPEPSTFALAGLGAAALLIFRRRQ